MHRVRRQHAACVAMAAPSKLVADDLPVELLTEIARHCTHSSAVAALSCCSRSARAAVEQAAKDIVRPILCAGAYRRPAHDAVTYSQLWLVHLVHNEPDWRANCLIGNFGRHHAIRLLERGADASLVVAAYRCDRETKALYEEFWTDLGHSEQLTNIDAEEIERREAERRAITKQMALLSQHKNSVLACVGMELVSATKRDPTWEEHCRAYDAMSERTVAEHWSIFLRGYAQAWRRKPGHELVRAVHVLLVMKSSYWFTTGYFMWGALGWCATVGSFWIPGLPLWPYKNDFWATDRIPTACSPEARLVCERLSGRTW